MSNKTKYSIDNVTLYYYCKINNLKYQNISASIRYYVSKSTTDFLLDDIVRNSIEIHIKIRNKKIILDQSLNLKKNIDISISEVKTLCKLLNLSSKNIIFISKKGYNIRSIIILMYYCASKRNKIGNKTMKTKDFQKLIIHFKEKMFDDIKIAILLYLAKISIKKEEIFNILNDGFILKKARKLVRKGYFPQHCTEDIASDYSMYMFELIDYLLPFEKEQVFKYVNIVLNNKISEIYQKYHQKEISLFTKINKYGNEKELIDYIAA